MTGEGCFVNVHGQGSSSNYWLLSDLKLLDFCLAIFGQYIYAHHCMQSLLLSAKCIVWHLHVSLGLHSDAGVALFFH